MLRSFHFFPTTPRSVESKVLRTLEYTRSPRFTEVYVQSGCCSPRRSLLGSSLTCSALSTHTADKMMFLHHLCSCSACTLPQRIALCFALHAPSRLIFKPTSFPNLLSSLSAMLYPHPIFVFLHAELFLPCPSLCVSFPCLLSTLHCLRLKLPNFLVA